LLTTIIVLAILQGLTEFLPVSSDGHLVVASELLVAAGFPPLPDVLEVNIVLHLGTLLSVLAFYFRQVCQLLGKDRRVIPLLIVGTLPAVVLGLPLWLFARDMLQSVLLAGLMLPVTGALVIWASRIPPGTLHYSEMGYGTALVIGLCQAPAVLPGLSRSGSTIAAGLAAGLERDSAATFSFLLAIPAISGAGVLELLKLSMQRPATERAMITPSLLLLGAALSFLVGLLALWWLIHWIHRGRLAYFAYWSIPLGIVVTCWQLWVRGAESDVLVENRVNHAQLDDLALSVHWCGTPSGEMPLAAIQGVPASPRIIPRRLPQPFPSARCSTRLPWPAGPQQPPGPARSPAPLASRVPPT
jgi:undecaprenyl-diphosphatase